MIYRIAVELSAQELESLRKAGEPVRKHMAHEHPWTVRDTAMEVIGKLLAAAQPTTDRYVAIGSDGFRPVVWGLGGTKTEAVANAVQHAADECAWADEGSAFCVVPAALALRIEEGENVCEALGIAVGVKDGRIVSAEVRP
jgi:formylmethanofuran dehydrogenase subunit B